MRVSPNRMMVLIVLGVVVASGCAYGEVRQVIRAQFASEFDCPEVQLRKRDSWYAQDNPNQFKVTGCGKVRTYTCDKDIGLVSYDTPACKFVEGDADAPGAAKPEPSNPATEPMPNDGAAPEPSSGGEAEPEPPASPSSDSSSESSDGLDSSADITSNSSSEPAKKNSGGKAKASVGVKAGRK